MSIPAPVSPAPSAPKTPTASRLQPHLSAPAPQASGMSTLRPADALQLPTLQRPRVYSDPSGHRPSASREQLAKEAMQRYAALQSAPQPLRADPKVSLPGASHLDERKEPLTKQRAMTAEDIALIRQLQIAGKV